MSAKDQVRFRIIEDFRAGRISRAEAAKILSISERSVSRLATKVRGCGVAGIKHGNTGRPPANRKPEALKDEVLNLVTSRYFDFNLKHCHEYLLSDHQLQLAYSTFHEWCKQKGLGRRRRRRASSHRMRRERWANEGLMLQMDGSHHKWNGQDEWCLIAMIDDATSEIPAAKFFEGETTWGCFTVLRHVIETKGVPEIIYTDEAGWAGGSSKRPHFSQFVRACEELGIRVITTPSAEAKGRIERVWRTKQDRLIPELRLNGVKSMLDSNRYLDQVFLPNYWNQRNTVEARAPESRYRKLASHIQLDHVLCMKHYRVVRRDHTVSYDTKTWSILDKEYGSLHKREIAAHVSERGEVSWHLGHIRLNSKEMIPAKRKWLSKAS